MTMASNIDLTKDSSWGEWISRNDPNDIPDADSVVEVRFANGRNPQNYRIRKSSDWGWFLSQIPADFEIVEYRILNAKWTEWIDSSDQNDIPNGSVHQIIEVDGSESHISGPGIYYTIRNYDRMKSYRFMFIDDSVSTGCELDSFRRFFATNPVM